jgi:hypothetical protein
MSEDCQTSSEILLKTVEPIRFAAAAEIRKAFSDCKLGNTPTENYSTVVFGDDGLTETEAVNLSWRLDEVWFTLFITDEETQIVCNDVEPCTCEPNNAPDLVQRLRRHLENPSCLNKYFSPSPG